MWEKKEATGAVGYVMLFTMAIIMVIITFFMLASAKLMTIQHDVDDALADSVLASLVADDIYYFETWEGTGTAVIRFRDLDESYRLYRDCMKDAIESKEKFYGNIQYPVFICYEVEGEQRNMTILTRQDDLLRFLMMREWSIIYYDASGQMKIIMVLTKLDVY